MTGYIFNLDLWGRKRGTAYRRALRIAQGIFNVLCKYSPDFDYFDVTYLETIVKRTRKNRMGLYKFVLYFHR